MRSVSGGRIRRAAALARSFAAAREGGALLAGGAFVIMVMATAGAGLSNYAWHEAQWAELDAATRAAASAVGPRLGGVGGEADESIRSRIAAFAAGLVDGMTVDDVLLVRESDDVVSVTVSSGYTFNDIWGDWGGDADVVQTNVRVKLEADRYEVAIALDVSVSMRTPLPGGTAKLDGLKTAVHAVADTLEAASATTPGGVLVSLVPFATAVNAADTCGRDPHTGLCTTARTVAKERYVRMLAGARPTLVETLVDARDARDTGRGGHWVDTFHHYGGSRVDGLRRRYLPDDLLDDVDWNLRRENVAIDVVDEVPALGAWIVDDEDFWNGCMMARWGAYWDPGARRPGWRADDPGNWPATKPVAAWSRGGTALPAGTPLHLSDAPPLASDPNTLFTTYSWPDARIGALADHRLQGAMVEAMEPGKYVGDPYYYRRTVGDNDWSLPRNSGRILCPEPFVTPLTDDFAAIRAATDALEVTPPYYGGGGTNTSTYVGPGVVWALRTLSPLWQDVWDTYDAGGGRRPAVPCAPGEDSADCDPLLNKSIVVVSDGANAVGVAEGSRLLAEPSQPENPYWFTTEMCQPSALFAAYYAAANATTEADFNGYFLKPYVDDDLVDAAGRLNAMGMMRIVDALLAIEDTGPDTPTRRAEMTDALAHAAPPGLPPTPWQLFRVLDDDVIDVLVDPAGPFGLDGRPVLTGQHCRPMTSAFSPYGRFDDAVRAGDDTGPVVGVAPLEIVTTPPVSGATGPLSAADRADISARMLGRLDGWLIEACRTAGARRVAVNAIFIGDVSPWTQPHIDILEQCVDASGGDPDLAEVHVTPTATDLEDTFRRLFTIRRNLRFLD